MSERDQKSKCITCLFIGNLFLLVSTIGKIFSKTNKMRKQTRTLERRSRFQLNRLNRDLRGLSDLVSDELTAGRRYL